MRVRVCVCVRTHSGVARTKTGSKSLPASIIGRDAPGDDANDADMSGGGGRSLVQQAPRWCAQVADTILAPSFKGAAGLQGAGGRLHFSAANRSRLNECLCAARRARTLGCPRWKSGKMRVDELLVGEEERAMNWKGSSERRITPAQTGLAVGRGRGRGRGSDRDTHRHTHNAR